MAVRSYRVRIVRGDEQFEAEGDKNFVLQMLRKFEPASTTTPGPPGAISGTVVRADPKTAASSKQVSIGEFIRQFGFKKHTDLVLAFGYYLEQHSGLKEFTAADINNCYYEAKMESSNVSQSIIQNMRRGLMMDAKSDKNSSGKRKRYTLTQTGESYIANFSKKAEKR